MEFDPQDTIRVVIQNRDGLTVPETMDDLQAHMSRMHQRRNRLWSPSRRERIRYLDFGIGELDDFVVKGAKEDQLRVMLARVVIRNFNVAEGVNGVSIARGMAEKYQLECCGYCFKMPCECRENRSDHVLVPASEIQMRWGVRPWQQHLGEMFGPANEARGLHYAMNRLDKERRELNYLESQVQKEDQRQNADWVEHQYSLECGDVMARTVAVANLLKIDLESAILDRYFPNCWSCHQNPCVCVGFNQKQVRVQ